MFSVLGLRPTATSSFSASSSSCLPSLVTSVSFTPLSVLRMFSARAPVSTRIFCLRKLRSSSLEMSSSSTGTMRGSISITVTSVPNRRNMEANSTPTAPAPITTRLWGTAVRSRISMLVRMQFGVGLQAGQHARLRAGRDNDVPRFERLRAGVRFHLHLAPALERGVARDALHLGALEQHLHAFGMLGDNAVLAVLHLGEIQARVLALDALGLRMDEALPHLGGLQPAPWWGCSPPAGRSRPAGAVFRRGRSSIHIGRREWPRSSRRGRSR